MARKRPLCRQTRAAAKTPGAPYRAPMGRYARRMRYPGDVDAGPAAGGQERPPGRPWLPWPRGGDGGQAGEAALPAEQFGDSGYSGDPEAGGQAGDSGYGGYGDSGYGDTGDSGTQDQGAAQARGAAVQTLYGAAGGTARKGPVRGFPPAPGQAPPVYPPGQFSAWNQASAATRPGGGTGKDAWPVAASAEHGYAEPDYSVLAVSDPAADATSTQTWAAVDDRTAGGWRDPHARDGKPTRADTRSPAGRRTRGHLTRQPAGAKDATAAPLPGTSEAGSRGGIGPPRAAAATVAGAGNAVQAPQAAGQAPQAAGQAPRTAGQAPRTASQAGGPPGRPARGSSRGKRGRKPAPAKRRRVLLAAGLAVVVVAASGTYYFLAGPGKAGQAAAPKTSQPAGPTTSPSPSPSPSGRWGLIQTRRIDPQPLTLAELFPARFSSNGSAYSRTAARAGKHCSGAVLGNRLQSAVRAAGCSQVLRASYLSGNKKLMGTIGVLNLKTAHNASKAGMAAGRSEFIAQLRGAKGPTRNLTKGTGIEEAEFKGHYLILIWAEFASLHAPKTTAKKNELVQFCTRLLSGTANVSLSRRLVTGKP